MSEETKPKTLMIWTFKMSGGVGMVQVAAASRVEAEKKLSFYLHSLYGANAAMELKIAREIFGGEVIV